MSLRKTSRETQENDTNFDTRSDSFLSSNNDKMRQKYASTRSITRRTQVYLAAIKTCYTTPMIIGVSKITLHLPDSQSLKDKRQIIKSFMPPIRNPLTLKIPQLSRPN